MISNNAKKAAEWWNIPTSTMDDYIKYSNLYKKSFIFIILNLTHIFND
jgi:hypothetical protein